jgi:hypothetical protein
MNVHEQAFVESFVRGARRGRSLVSLASPKKRRKFVLELAHRGTYILAPECLRSIKPGQQNSDSIYAILGSPGAADTCHVISAGRFDGREME